MLTKTAKKNRYIQLTQLRPNTNLTALTKFENPSQNRLKIRTIDVTILCSGIRLAMGYGQGHSEHFRASNFKCLTQE